jgi:cell division protein ZapA
MSDSTHVSVKINNRTYQVGCEEGQAQHVEKLASYLDRRVAELAGDVGQVGDARLLVMASLLIADELADTYDELHDMRTTLPADAGAPQPAVSPAEEVKRGSGATVGAVAARIRELEIALKGTEEQLAPLMETIAARIEAVAERLEGR